MRVCHIYRDILEASAEFFTETLEGSTSSVDAYDATLAFSFAVIVRYVPRFLNRASAFSASLLTSVSTGGTDCYSEGLMPALSIGRR